MTSKELLYPPPMEEYWKVGDPNHEQLPVLEIKPSPDDPMWILVNHLASDPNASFVSIKDTRSNGSSKLDPKHVSVWVLPEGIGVIDDVWGDEDFISLVRQPHGSDQIRERVINIANRALHNRNEQ